MIEEKRAGAKPAADKPAAKAAAPSPALSPAAASSDPAVHQLLAEIQTARANGNDEEIERLTKALADLGFE